MNNNLMSNTVTNLAYAGNGQSIPAIFSDEGWVKSGNLRNGRLEGVGTLFYQNGKVRCTGNFVNGVLNGTATIYYENGTVMYQGNLSNGTFNGKGTLYHNVSGNSITGNFIHYSGQFADGVPHGMGAYYFFKSTIKQYEGCIVNGLRHGEGTLYYENGNMMYKGSFKDGAMHGNGEYYGDGEVLSGECFKFNGINGEGSVKNAFTTSYGTFVNGKLNGNGVAYYNEGGCYYTFFVDGVANGKTYRYDASGRLIESVNVVNGLRQGNGIEFIYDQIGTRYGRKKREYRAQNDVRYYIDNEAIDADSVYWDILFSPTRTSLDGTLNSGQVYELLLDLLNNKAEHEIDILSPWLGRWLLKEEFCSALLNALNRGVYIKIVTGLDDDRQSTTLEVKRRLEELFGNHESGRLSIVTRNTHEKMLICDNEFMLIGSHNQLSYKPGGSDNRGESMYMVKDGGHIFYNRLNRFNFF